MHNSEGSSFSISGGGADFANRQKDLFEKLKEAEKGVNISHQDVIAPSISHHPTQREELAMDFEASNQLKRKRRSETKHLRGKESIFKRPEVPPPWQGRKMPDHKKNPQKWTRYSLGDVSQDDMSDTTNTSTALSFLSELRKRKETSGPMDDDDDEREETRSQGSIVFKRPNTSRRAVVEIDDQPVDRLESSGPVFRGSKRVMPEYIVGQGSKRSSKKKDDKKSQEKNATKELKLDHLFEPEIE